MTTPRPHARTPRHDRRRTATRKLSLEHLESRELLATILVTTASDAAVTLGTEISLRQAIAISNGDLAVSALTPRQQSLVIGPLSDPAPNSIVFDIPTLDLTQPLHTIHVTSQLPAITKPVWLYGSSQTGSLINPSDKPEGQDFASPAVQIDGQLFSPADPAQDGNGLVVAAPNCGIQGLIITGFAGAGVWVRGDGSQGNLLVGNIIGALPDPAKGRFFTESAALGNRLAGVRISSSNNRIGDNSAAGVNVIANNGVGVVLDNPSGTRPVGGVGNQVGNSLIVDNHAQGVLITSSNNAVGQTVGRGGNFISGNAAQGVLITGGLQTQGNTLLNNKIGVDLADDVSVQTGVYGPRPNFLQGVQILDSPRNVVGGVGTGGGNVIGANRLDGIAIDGPQSSGNRVLNNFVGFDQVGRAISLGLGNRNGIAITAPGNTIGDPLLSGSGNTVSNNRNHGIYLSTAAASGNTIAGNVIGLNPGGGSRLSNAFDGVRIDGAPNNTVGGTTAAARNTISSNNNGVYLLGAGATGNIVEGNFIGTAGDGLTDLGNAVDGVVVDNAPLNTVGAAGAGNVISGNNQGVRLTGAGATKNQVQANFIGTDLQRQAVVSNKIDGVFVTAGASNNLIGGATAADGNTVANNAGVGVNLDDGTANAVLSNAIYANTGRDVPAGVGRGIVLNAATGANRGQPMPVLTSVSPANGLTNVQGSITAAPNTVYTVQFFSSPEKDASGFGQGQTLLYTARHATTDATGRLAFNGDLPVGVASGLFVTATATDPSGNTSAFSNALPAVPVQFRLGAASYTVNESDGAAAVTVVRTGGQGGAASVDYTVGGGTAVAGVDFRATTGTLYFNPGDPASKTFVIPILDPHKVSGSVTAGVTLGRPTGGATLGDPAAATLTIVGNEVAVVQFPATPPGTSPYTFFGTTTAAFVVTRNTGEGTATVRYATSDGSAVAGINYVPAAGVLTFTPGQTAATVPVTLLDDSRVHAGPLTFRLTLGQPVGAVLGAMTSVVAAYYPVQNPGAFRVGVPTVVAAPGATSATVTVVRVGGMTGSVSVHYATAGGSALPGVDFAPVSGTLTFAPGETAKVVAVPLGNTNRPGPDLAFTFGLSVPGGGATLVAPSAAVVTVLHPAAPADRTPPTVTGVQALTGPGGVNAVAVSFSEPMDPARAQDLGNYGSYLVTPGRDGVLGTYDDGSIAFTRAAYDPALRRTVLTLAAPLPAGTFARLVLNRDATAGPRKGLADLAGKLLDGTGTGAAAGTPYTALVGVGRTRVSALRTLRR